MSEWFDNFLAFDSETTGLGEDARIVELAVIRFENLKPVDTWDTLINPVGVDWESESVKGALAVNKLERTQLEDAPTFQELMPTIIGKMMCAPTWVAHNTEFDLRMLRQEFERHNSVEPQPELALDTLLLDYGLNVGFLKRKLSFVCPRWGVVLENGHRARIDAMACGNVLCKMAPKLPRDTSLLKKAMEETAQEWARICARARARDAARA